VDEQWQQLTNAGAIGVLLYLVPALIGAAGWVRHRKNEDARGLLITVVMLDVLFAWTIIGWIAAFAIACYLLAGISDPQPEASADAPYFPQIWGTDSTDGWTDETDRRVMTSEMSYEPPAWASAQWAEERTPCQRCHDQGGEVCPRCLGTRGTWIHPQTESGTSQWEQCCRCIGSGKVQCTGCGKG
jgi:hypothetical protein